MTPDEQQVALFRELCAEHGFPTSRSEMMELYGDVVMRREWSVLDLFAFTGERGDLRFVVTSDGYDGFNRDRASYVAGEMPLSSFRCTVSIRKGFGDVIALEYHPRGTYCVQWANNDTAARAATWDEVYARRCEVCGDEIVTSDYGRTRCHLCPPRSKRECRCHD